MSKLLTADGEPFEIGTQYWRTTRRGIVLHTLLDSNRTVRARFARKSYAKRENALKALERELTAYIAGLEAQLVLIRQKIQGEEV